MADESQLEKLLKIGPTALIERVRSGKISLDDALVELNLNASVIHRKEKVMSKTAETTTTPVYDLMTLKQLRKKERKLHKKLDRFDAKLHKTQTKHDKTSDKLTAVAEAIAEAEDQQHSEPTRPYPPKKHAS